MRILYTPEKLEVWADMIEEGIPCPEVVAMAYLFERRNSIALLGWGLEAPYWGLPHAGMLQELHSSKRNKFEMDLLRLRDTLNFIKNFPPSVQTICARLRSIAISLKEALEENLPLNSRFTREQAFAVV